MGLSLQTGTCPECEGFGKAVDRFQPPVDGFSCTDLPGQTLAILLTPHRPSDGRVYRDEPCPVCQGQGQIAAVVTPSGALADWWPLYGAEKES